MILKKVEMTQVAQQGVVVVNDGLEVGLCVALRGHQQHSVLARVTQVGAFLGHGEETVKSSLEDDRQAPSSPPQGSATSLYMMTNCTTGSV